MKTEVKAEPAFIPGMVLSRSFFHEVVQGIVESTLAGVPYSAGLIDYGSDVLGFDDATSRDHQWGPRLSIFLLDADVQTHGQRLDEALARQLPREFKGYSTHFSGTRADRIRQMAVWSEGEVGHLIRIHSPREFFEQHLGLSLPCEPSVGDWLMFPQQRLLTVRRGQLFHDDLKVQEVQKRLAFYPHEVWLYLMSVEWQKISAEESFVGRTGDRGDDIGSRLIAARLVERLMRLRFLQCRQYFPYAKWFGTAFSELEGAQELAAVLSEALQAKRWPAREEALCRAYVQLADHHNRLGLTPFVEPSLSDFHERPYRVIFAARFAEALSRQITDDTLRRAGMVGSVDQITDHVTLLSDMALLRERLPAPR